MAGSYGHTVDDEGKLYRPSIMSDMLENGGDVYEAVEELYGMIWFLADGDPDKVAEARARYDEGILLAPGKQKARDIYGRISYEV